MTSINYAQRALDTTEGQLFDRLAALKSTVASWTPDRVHHGEVMTAASALAEVATLAARAAAQRETVVLLVNAEEDRKKS